MFIIKGEKRINTDFIKEYKPDEKIITNKKSYYIEITYLDGSSDSYCFFDKKEERDIFLKKMDDLFLKIYPNNESSISF